MQGSKIVLIHVFFVARYSKYQYYFLVTIYLITPVIIYILKVRKCITYFISICIFACS